MGGMKAEPGTGDGARTGNATFGMSLGKTLESHIPRLIAAWRSMSGRTSPEGRLTRQETVSVGEALLALQRGLTGERRLAGSGYMDDPDLLGAYLLYYWPVSYLQTGLALEALAPKLPAGAKVLDLGSGPGPAAAAIADWQRRCLPMAGSQASRFLLADSSRAALGLARNLLGDGAVESRVLDLEKAGLEGLADRGPFDLVVMGHCLNELWPSSPSARADRLDLARKVLGSLAPGGIFLVVEPSLLRTSRDLLALRDDLAADGSPILGPCLRQGSCPALAAGPGHTCHSEAPWSPPEPVASLAAAAGLDRNSVKMTWMAVGGTISAPSTHAARLLDTDRETALVVSEPMLNKAGRLRYLLCNDAGRFAVSVRHDDPAARAAGFFDLRRGDRICLRGTELRGGPEANALGFLPSSALEILAPSPSIQQGRCHG